MADLLWPGNEQLPGTADERAACFEGLQKPSGLMCTDGSCGKQASTLLELMTIRAYHSKSLRQCGLGTAIGFRTRNGELTSTPAIIVFVARKVHTQWLHEMQILPSSVEVLCFSLPHVNVQCQSRTCVIVLPEVFLGRFCHCQVW